MNRRIHIWKIPSGDNFYHRLLAVSARDARLFLWSFRATVLLGFVIGYSFLSAALWPLVSLLRGNWEGVGKYFAGMILWPLPFLLVMLVARHVNLRIAQRYQHLMKK